MAKLHYIKKEFTPAVKCTLDEYSLFSSTISDQNSENKQEIDTASEIRKFIKVLDDGILQ